MTPAQRKWIKHIHVAKRQLGFTDDMYRSFLSGAAGVTSSADITTWAQYQSVMAGFAALGFKLTGSSRKTDNVPRCGNHITRRQEYYIRGLWNLASREKDEKSLRAMVQRIAGVDDISFCNKQQAAKVILALRAITADAGFNPDRKPEG